MNDKIALYLVNGALGAGKTTLVDFLVQQPEFAGARVIENEFASESINNGKTWAVCLPRFHARGP